MKKGLGRGLGSMLADYDTEDSTQEIKADVTKISIDLLDCNLEQPRKNFDQESLNELTNSIRQHGILQPIVVAKNGERYLIIAGERRFRAAREADLSEIPVIIKDYSKQQILSVAIIENVQREDLRPMEIARAYQTIIDKYSLTHDELAEQIGKSRSSISNALRILGLEEYMQEALDTNKISMGHAKAILSIRDVSKHKEVLLRIIKDNLSVRETEQYIKNITRPKVVKEKIELSPQYKKYEDDLRNILGTKVTISHKKNPNQGKIEIEYHNEDDFMKILEIVKTQQ
ncbi:MAG: hypothetical protein ATN36_00980 [Epulopiscium sp. Nele67-Bin005]|nr:MAG: hypothetical protein ATN36_00980 [Epulopiscium sp. Nele67-Bin005]